MDSDQIAKASIICPSSIMKSAIASSLEENGIHCCSNGTDPNVAIIVSGLIPRPQRGRSVKEIENIKATQWVVLTHQNNDPVCQSLIESGYDPCVVPEDIDGEDLSHVVRLAASGYVLSIGNFCRSASADDAKILNKANLTPDNWRLMGYLAEGLSNKEIAIKEDTTEGAVKAKLRCLLKKLDLSNRTKAAVLAARCGITSHEEFDEEE